MRTFRLITATTLALMITCAVARGQQTSVLEIAPLPHPDQVYPDPPSWKNKRVVHFGDSHVSSGLTSTLGRLFRRAGARYQPQMWVGSRSKSWVTSGRLRRLLDQESPNVVVITLGTNALGVSRLEKYIHWVKKVISHVGPRQCFWLGPPPLLEDRYGLNKALQEAIGTCAYFDARPLNFPPREDGKFHLTREQGEQWANSAWEWMNSDPSSRARAATPAGDVDAI